MPRPSAPRPLPSRPTLVRQLDEAFRGPAWHGPSLLHAVRGVRADDALWRPGPGRPNIWEQVLHCALGKHIVADRLDPSRTVPFPRPRTSAWWSPAPQHDDPAARERAWREDLALLRAAHQRLLDTLRRVPLARLRAPHAGSRFVLGEHVAGLALHDSYHAGQIALVRKLVRQAAPAAVVAPPAGPARGTGRRATRTRGPARDA